MYQLLDPSRFVVFITGATSGFGAAAARRYVAAGGKVIATGRRRDGQDVVVGSHRAFRRGSGRTEACAPRPAV